jgi:hypothetical protein
MRERFHNFLAPVSLLLAFGNKLTQVPVKLQLLAVDGLQRLVLGGTNALLDGRKKLRLISGNGTHV